MKKHVFGRQLKRDVNERKALFKNLLTSLVLKDRIRTTEAKARAIRADADKLVTKVKKAHSTGSGQGGNAYKNLHPDINQEAVVKLIEDIVPRFDKRQGGYTRMIKIGKRRVADNAPMAYLEWTERSAKQNNLEQGTKNKKQGKKKIVKKVNKEAKKTSTAIVPEIKKQPKMREVVRKLVTRQKKGQ